MPLHAGVNYFNKPVTSVIYKLLQLLLLGT